MSPRPKTDHLRKPQIVAAAAEVLYERGLFDTRVGDIAERAGTSAGTIMYYFESKDRLLEEAVDHTDQQFYERVSEGLEEHDSAGAKLVHLVEETSLGPGLSALMDGLGVQLTLGQPDVTRERMVDRCLAMASRELGCELRRNGRVAAQRGGTG